MSKTRKRIIVTVDTDLTDKIIELHPATLYLCEGLDSDLCHPAVAVAVEVERARPARHRRVLAQIPIEMRL